MFPLDKLNCAFVIKGSALFNTSSIITNSSFSGRKKTKEEKKKYYIPIKSFRNVQLTDSHAHNRCIRNIELIVHHIQVLRKYNK